MTTSEMAEMAIGTIIGMNFDDDQLNKAIFAHELVIAFLEARGDCRIMLPALRADKERLESFRRERGRAHGRKV